MTAEITPIQIFLALLQSVIVLLLGLGLKGIWSINDQLRQLNGRIGKVETWQEGHEKLDDERHESISERIDRMGKYIDKK